MDLDAGTRAKIRLIYPDLAVRYRRVFQDMWRMHHLPLRITEGVRTMARQEELYAQGRTTPGNIVTNAKPGDSMHHFGCAIDSCFRHPDPYLTKETRKYRDAMWAAYGAIARAHGFVWGGDWNGNGVADKNDWDLAHIQLTYGYREDVIRELYRKGGLQAVWAAFDKARGVPPGQDWNGPQTKAKLIEFGHIVG